MKRGQASIEFVLVLLLALIIIMTIIVPLGERLQGSLEDVAKVGSLTTDLRRMEQIVTTLSSQKDANGTQFITIYLPKDSTFICDPNGDVSQGIPGFMSVSTRLSGYIFDYNGSEIPATYVDGQLIRGCTPLSPSIPDVFECARYFPVPTKFQRLLCGKSVTEPFLIQSGARGFTQRLSIAVRYANDAAKPDLNVAVI